MKRRIALGFALATILLGLLINFAGSAEVGNLLSTANFQIIGLGVVSGALALTFRGLVWIQFLRLVDNTMPRRSIGSIFLAAMFVKYVTPYGQVATEPFVAYLVSRNAEMAYEDGFAGILSADLLNYVPYYTFGFMAIAWIAISGTFGTDIHSYLLAFGGLFTVVVTFAYVVVRQPTIIYRVVLIIAAILDRTIGRLTDRFAESLGPDAVRSRLDGFYRSIETITTDRRTLVIATTYAHIGMVFLMLPVYLGAISLGYEISLPVVALVVALGKLGVVVPSPGGLGGVEAAVMAGLTGLAGFETAAALTIALIYRFCTYWLTIFVGGIFSIGLVFRK